MWAASQAHITALAAKVVPLSNATEANRDTRREYLQCVHSIPLGEPLVMWVGGFDFCSGSDLGSLGFSYIPFLRLGSLI